MRELRVNCTRERRKQQRCCQLILDVGNSWRKVTGILCDRKVLSSVKGKLLQTVIRPPKLYEIETVSVTKRKEVATMKMLPFSSGLTKLDKVPVAVIRRKCQTASATNLETHG